MGIVKSYLTLFVGHKKFGYVIPGTSHEIQTTLAQLNFIKWCIKNNIIDYIRSNKTSLFTKSLT
jgi:hypothetical protein